MNNYGVSGQTKIIFRLKEIQKFADILDKIEEDINELYGMNDLVKDAKKYNNVPADEAIEIFYESILFMQIHLQYLSQRLFNELKTC